PEEITEADLTDFWRQLHLAHNAGIAHRSLTSSHVRRDEAGAIWIAGWESGEVASSELSRRMDLAQALTMLATRVGTPRALRSASAVLTEEELTSLTPLLQRIAMPQQTRAQMPRRLLQDLREEVLRLVPAAADTPPQRLQRLTFKQLLTISAVFAAAVILFGTFNWNEVIASFRAANAWWLLAAFGAGLFTYWGAALSLVSFTPERLGLWRSTLVQVASALIALVAPAGVGPAAMEARYLIKQNVKTPLAVATVTLVQVSKFVSTIALLLAITLVAGAAGGSNSVAIPSGPIMIAVGVVVAVVGILMAIPVLRNWAIAKILPVLRQIWPRILWVFANPGRLAAGLLGNVIQTVAFVAAFGFTLAAFGYTLPVAALALTYLASNSAGSLVPSPAGIGPVELALTSGLTIAGIPSPVAVSVTIVFRVLTLWARVPLGWPALRYLQSRDVL
ncbi:MAG: lysylphosphatidylglycerol synthase transmembrane domain-containing protein, partial [bacterium]|nr:lysylphosphatidylglycerol synthase transmembrane domain-containing protein [bacterium]